MQNTWAFCILNKLFNIIYYTVCSTFGQCVNKVTVIIIKMQSCSQKLYAYIFTTTSPVFNSIYIIFENIAKTFLIVYLQLFYNVCSEHV